MASRLPPEQRWTWRALIGLGVLIALMVLVLGPLMSEEILRGFWAWITIALFIAVVAVFWWLSRKLKRSL